MIDIFLPLGRGSFADDIELRIALRSIHANADNLRRVWVVGHRPRWLRETSTVKCIEMDEFRVHKESRIAMKVLWAFENVPEMSDRVAFWNDDYVLCQRVDISSIPNFHCGGLFMKRKTRWGLSRRRTHAALLAAGLPTKHYDIHLPIIYERQKFLSIGDWMSRGYVTKSVYGNHFCAANSRRHSDCKLGSNWGVRIQRKFANRFILSYGNGAVKRGIANWLLAKFPSPTEAEVY